MLKYMHHLLNYEIIKYVVEESGLLFLWSFKMQMKINFMVFWKFGYLALESFGIFLKELVRTLLTLAPFQPLIFYPI